MGVMLKSKLGQTIPLLLAGGAAALGHFGSICGFYKTCIMWPYLNGLVSTLLDPVTIFALYSLPGLMLLPFVSKKVFSIWLKFAALWLALTIFMVATAPEAMNAWFYIFDTTKSNTAEFMGAAFSVITLALLPITALAFYSRSKGYR